ncbi:nitroreductase family protein [Pseudonocardia sp. GCM10023141]|uniref:nitroreductase family protein n=1 Tax=Pseudonocardia sp. GCM10023141 TaxID=3252653 RepID=UPI00361609CB
MCEPAPDRAQLRELLLAAGSAPDHGRLRPWRFIAIEGASLGPLGDAFASAHAERDPAATDVELGRSRSKPLRAPLIVVVVACPREHPKVPAWEQRAAAVCAAHGLTLAAHAVGFGAMWRTGWYGDAPKVRAHLGLLDTEDVTGWIYLGTPRGNPPPPRPAEEPPVTWLD